MKPDNAALARWLAEQQRQQGIIPSSTGSQLHLHQHHYYFPHPIQQPQPVQTPSLPDESRYAATKERSERMHPLTLALSVLVFSLALAIPLAILGTILQPQPEYHYHQRW
jgi:hypothetical protein